MANLSRLIMPQGSPARGEQRLKADFLGVLTHFQSIPCISNMLVLTIIFEVFDT